MSSPAPFWNRKTLMLITGASQGIGQFWAVEFSKKLAKDSVVLLLARSESKLEETKKKVQAANPAVIVKTHPIDLAKAKGSDFVQYLSEFQGSQFELNFLVNNAGSVGDVKKFAVDMKDEVEWNDYLALNVVSFATLTSAFVAQFGPTPGETCIVNVTSLAAVQPMPSFGFYCVGKAARESYVKVLATENPKLNVLNYSPGPIHTDMVQTILNDSVSTEIQKGFSAMRDGNSFVTLEATTEKIINALADRAYASPGRIDFYDRPE